MGIRVKKKRRIVSFWKPLTPRLKIYRCMSCDRLVDEFVWYCDKCKRRYKL